MNILSIYKGHDTGGWGYRLGEAFKRHTDWSFHSMYAPNAFLWIDYPADLVWEPELARRAYAEADVVHLHNGLATAHIFERNAKPKPSVVHYHGTSFRQNPTAYLGQQRRRGCQGIVSTLDLWLIAPDELEWVPSPYQLEWLHELRS